MVELSFEAESLFRTVLLNFKSNQKSVHFIHHADIRIVKNIGIELPIQSLNLRNPHAGYIIVCHVGYLSRNDELVVEVE